VRLLRALQRVEHAEGDATARLDDLYFFFQNCWHLKDWIRNDVSIPKALRNLIVREVETTERLLICADIANGSKHLALKKTRKGASIVKAKLSTVEVETGEVLSETDVFGVSWRQGVPQPYGILELARKAVEDWKNILNKYGLGV
jgi:hypothetical protein